MRDQLVLKVSLSRGLTGMQEQRVLKMTKYFDDKTVAEITGRSLSALRKDRMQGKGIPYLKVGRQVRYTGRDIDTFMEKCRVRVKPLSMTEA